MKRLLLAVAVLTLGACQCGLSPVDDCSVTNCDAGVDAGESGGGTATGGGDSGGGTATGGGDNDGGTGGGSTATGGGDMGGGSATGGGEVGGGSASTGGGSTATGGGSTTVGGGTALGGGSASGGGSPAGGGTAVDAGIEVCSVSARARCEYFSRCLMFSDDTLVSNRSNTLLAANQLANCIAQQTTLSGCQVAQTGMNLGRSTVDQARFTSCMASVYPSNSCVRDLNDAVTRCQIADFITGTGATGAPCTSDFECASGSCTIANNATCGTCSTWANADGGVGSRCTKDSMCDPSRSYCPGDDGNPPGNNTTCANFKALDAGCNQGTTEFGQQEECGPGRVCAGNLVNGFRCATGKPEGASCTKNNAECLRSGRGVTELTCATTAPNTNTCVKTFNTVAGGNCSTGELGLSLQGPPYCLETEFCSSNVCVPRRMANQPCTDSSNCQAGFRCAGTIGNRVCTAFGDVGASCNQSSECRGLLTCSNNQCVPSLAALGAPCSTQNNAAPQCAEGYCDGTGSAIGTCTALKADGQACTRGAQCQSYSCVNSVCTRACWQP